MNSEKPTLFSPPPRLLLGVSFLFWGAMHDRPLPALVAAILMEGRHWTSLRWEFGEKGFARSWQVSVVILVVCSLGLLQVEDRAASDFFSLLSWLPFMMMPLALAQQYASDPGVPVTTFSFVARRKLVADRKAGREVTLSYTQLGYPYFLLILIVSGMGVGMVLKPGADEIRYAIGVALLLGWAVFVMERRPMRKGAWGLAYLCSLVMAVMMSWAVIAAYQYFVKSMTRPSERSRAAFEAQTSMGEVHRLQLSPKILWRYYHEAGEVPDLVRISAYNTVVGNVWSSRMRRFNHRERIPRGREIGGDFQAFLKVGTDEFLFDEEDRGFDDYETRGVIEGMVSDQTLVPHPAHTKRYEDVPTEILSVNSMGAVQLNAPRQGAMRMGIFADDRLKAIEHDPSTKDVEVPLREEAGLRGYLQGLGLEVPPERKDDEAKPREVGRPEFERLRGLLGKGFREGFEYSLLLKGSSLNEPVTEFLEETRKGHCEYFASATALLLRRMEVPTRYVVGFSVQESGGANEYLLRGKHAHAWAQAYVGGSWVNESKPGKDPVWRCRGGEWMDVDLTPPDWLSMNDAGSWMQGVFDWWQKRRAKLVMWMGNPGVARGVKYALVIVTACFLIYLVWTLVRNRSRKGAVRPGSWEEKVRKQGILRDFERWLCGQVGPRPEAIPLGVWLRKHLEQDGAELAESYERATFGSGGASVADLNAEIREVKVRWKKAQKNP